jgi:hypothetical protein
MNANNESEVNCREAKSEYNESLAQPVADNKTEGSSLAFTAR